MQFINGLGKFVLGLLTSWPLLIGLALFFYRDRIHDVMRAITHRIRKSTTVKLPGGIELTETQQAITSLAQDVLRLKQKEEAAKGSVAVDRQKEGETLQQLIDEYDHKTSIPDYAERMRIKTSIHDRMVRLLRGESAPISHLLQSRTEGSLLAVVSASRYLPDPEAFDALIRAGRLTKHQFVRNALLFQFVELLSAGKRALPDEIIAARKLAEDYERDPASPPDRTFARNLIYYKQVLNAAIHGVPT